MENPDSVATAAPGIDPVLFEHALERATEDLRRIATSIADRYLKAGLASALSWSVLLEIDEQAFSDLAFQSRNEAAVVDALARIGPAALPGVDLSGLIDWTLADASLPIVYLSVRERLSAADLFDRAQAAA
ncbi:DUF2471 domain-containing protein [Burkholderia sp. AU33545]|uniref:DUF2471 family protein n=1 Tax=Burkholderia sp. AU33545 TaxID=2879631 RepID=UPI001CF31346|nr:DUF2471 family protein [Burkholderia sp. AU33545]MCA8205167.1 DUF2471 domain-containing protein [Burkholderia sp. AU33545]